MITGTVNGYGEAVVPLIMLDDQERGHETQAVIDTGFNGYLTLPPALIEAFGLAWRARTTVVLGDGSRRELELFTGRVVWDDRIRTLDVGSADVEPLIGVDMLRGHVIEIHMVEGGSVLIERLP